MRTTILAAALTLLAVPAFAGSLNFMDFGRVVAVHPAYGTVNQPVQTCSVPPADPNANVVGNVTGGLLGGLLGHQVGHGRGNTLATIGGALGGAYMGGRVEGSMKQPKCYLTDHYVEAPVGYNAVVQYGRHRFNVLFHHPVQRGAAVRLAVGVDVAEE